MRIEHFLCVLFGLVKSGQGFIEDVPEDVFALKQVVILSRHGLRTPLSKYLTQMTPKKWPQWREKPGYLTAKGAQLEGYMGQFFSLWFHKRGLISKKCPTDSEFYVYANTKQRTQASASAFVSNAFPGCNITIHHSKTNIDPIFNPIIHNTSSTFLQIVIKDMQNSLNRLSVNATYIYLENILDYKDSEYCKTEKQCDLLTDQNKVIVKVGNKPNVQGPIKIGNSVIDAFVMQYYEGFPLENVAWDSIRNSKDWLTIMKVSRGYHNVIFNTLKAASDISKPLIKYMTKIFFNDSVPVSLLMGHDANLYTVMKTLRFTHYMLPNQYELAPVGGKLVFQKWYDSLRNEYLLKIDYVYQSSKQLREATKLDLKNPPEFKLMKLQDCETDVYGFCPWEQFIKILEST